MHFNILKSLEYENWYINNLRITHRANGVHEYVARWFDRLELVCDVVAITSALNLGKNPLHNGYCISFGVEHRLKMNPHAS